MVAFVILEIETKEEKIEEMRKFLTKNLPAALAFEGCRGVELVENMDKPGNLVFFETWESRQHYEKYYAWRVSIGVLDAFVAMLKQEPQIRYFSRFDT